MRIQNPAPPLAANAARLNEKLAFLIVARYKNSESSAAAGPQKRARLIERETFLIELILFLNSMLDVECSMFDVHVVSYKNWVSIHICDFRVNSQNKRMVSVQGFKGSGFRG